AYGAMFDSPDQIAFTVVGDGEAETGPLATSWHSNKFVNPQQDGVVLPILHLNGYKIANPTVLARIGEDELESLLRGCGHTPLFFTGGFDDEDPLETHRRFAEVLDRALDQIAQIKQQAAEDAEAGRESERPAWPMIVLRTPKGWTGPEEVDGQQVEGSWRSHQVPLSGVRDSDEHLAQLDAWLRSYRPEELLDEHGTLVPQLAAAVRRAGPAAPGGGRRDPHARVAPAPDPAHHRRVRARPAAPAGHPRLRGADPRPGRRLRRGDAGAGHLAAGCDPGQSHHLPD